MRALQLIICFVIFASGAALYLTYKIEYQALLVMSAPLFLLCVYRSNELR